MFPWISSVVSLILKAGEARRNQGPIVWEDKVYGVCLHHRDNRISNVLGSRKQKLIKLKENKSTRRLQVLHTWSVSISNHFSFYIFSLVVWHTYTNESRIHTPINKVSWLVSVWMYLHAVYVWSVRKLRCLSVAFVRNVTIYQGPATHAYVPG